MLHQMKQDSQTTIVDHLRRGKKKQKKNRKKKKKSKKVENKNSITNTKNFTVFLSFTINNENLNKNSVVELVDKKIQSGSFKIKKNDIFNNILIFDLYENNIFVKSYSIEHPLYKNVEFVDDNFNLNTKSIKLTTAEFFLRIHTNSENFLIKLFEKIGQKEKKIIKTISI